MSSFNSKLGTHNCTTGNSHSTIGAGDSLKMQYEALVTATLEAGEQAEQAIDKLNGRLEDEKERTKTIENPDVNVYTDLINTVAEEYKVMMTDDQITEKGLVAYCNAHHSAVQKVGSSGLRRIATGETYHRPSGLRRMTSDMDRLIEVQRMIS